MGEGLLVVKSGNDLEGMKLKSPNKEIVSYLIPAVIFECDGFNLLAELATGAVVLDIDKSNVINVPAIEEISMNEMALLEEGMKLGQFSPEDVSFGMNIYRVEVLLSDLLKKKFVTLQNHKYLVADRFRFLYHPEQYATNVVPEKINVDGKKIEAKVNIAQVRDKLERVTKINSFKECWILYNKLK